MMPSMVTMELAAPPVEFTPFLPKRLLTKY
jgi:hypothetical protein